jgi:hypothetical protein
MRSLWAHDSAVACRFGRIFERVLRFRLGADMVRLVVTDGGLIEYFCELCEAADRLDRGDGAGS